MILGLGILTVALAAELKQLDGVLVPCHKFASG